MPPNALTATLRAGQWGTYALIGGGTLIAVAAVAVALLSMARAPSATTGEAARTLHMLSQPNGAPSETPSANPSAAASEAPAATASAPASMPSAAVSQAPSATPSAAASATPSAAASQGPTATPSATATAAPSAAPTAVASAPAPASSEGTISTPQGAAGHRVFVDGRYTGDSPGPLKVHCGQHSVKVGSGGTPHTVEVPCGGDIVVTPG